MKDLGSLLVGAILCWIAVTATLWARMGGLQSFGQIMTGEWHWLHHLFATVL